MLEPQTYPITHCPRCETSLSNVQEAGMQFNELAGEELERIREAVAGVYDRHAETIGQDVIDRMQAELATLRGE